MPLDAAFLKQFQEAAHPEKAFRQLQVIRGDTLDAALRSRVSEGFCFGGCLDWLRKVILRDDDGRHTVSHEKISRVTRMAKVHVAYKAESQALQARVDERSAEKQDEAERNLVRWLAANNISHSVDRNGLLLSYNRTTNRAGRNVARMIQERVDVYNREVAEINRAVREYNERPGSQKVQAAWKKTLAGELKKLDTGKRRTFAQITPVKCSATKHYTKYSDFLQDAFGQREWTIGRGMILGMDFIPKPGHFVAVHRAKETTYYLLDPSIGVYRCDTQTDMIYALLVLAEVGYVDPNQRLGDEHDWTLFCKTGDAFPKPADPLEAKYSTPTQASCKTTTAVMRMMNYRLRAN
jgi:hypothetical protein